LSTSLADRVIARRQLITLLGAGAAAWPLGAHAQQGERMRRIGLMLGLADDPKDKP
jgi:putative ABC transport system substrate-binding protein